MSKKLFALLLLAAAGSSVNAGARWNGLRERCATGWAYAKDGAWVLKPALPMDNKDGKLDSYLDTFKSEKLKTAEMYKRFNRWIGIPYSVAFTAGTSAAAFFAVKGIAKKIQVRRAAKKALADKELA